MAETLLAILLVTRSAKGSSLVHRWPQSPVPSPRLSRARLDEHLWPSQLDNIWKASHPPEHDPDPQLDEVSNSDSDYRWQGPNAKRDRSQSFPRPSSHPGSGRNSPSQDNDDYSGHNEYERLFGFNAEFLAGMLCPNESMCHQKFELVVDDLVFIGHPVCREPNVGWRFKPEKLKNGGRGREKKQGDSPFSGERSLASPESTVLELLATSKSSWLDTFHLVVVLDLPDPSSSASGNVSKYFEIIYEQIAFTVTAVLFQEQVLSNFVEKECDILGSLKDLCVSKGEPFSSYESQALEVSSIASAMKTIYEAIKSSSVAFTTINDLPLELQLPPYLDMLLHSEGEHDLDSMVRPEDDDPDNWGLEMGTGWRLPTLLPWKSLLLLDEHTDIDSQMNLRGPYVNGEDKALAEGLIRFLETASVTLSLADMASLLDWDLDAQIYPTVRWLVHHRRAKVVDLVHAGLRTVFMLPPTFNIPLSQLMIEFEQQFTNPLIPTLPLLLSAISTAISKQTDNHFFASVVKVKEHIPLYHEVVLWMLKRDMLVTLHLRIRVVATRELKLRVRLQREHSLAKKAKRESRKGRAGSLSDSTSRDLNMFKSNSTRSGISWLPLSPKTARRYARREISSDSGRSEISELIIDEDDTDNHHTFGFEQASDESEANSEADEEDSGWDTSEDSTWPTMIDDPGRATPLQRRWLAAMSEGKESHIARRFQLINQYFDGKRSDDEILHRAEISRKQLREVLHHYEDYLQTFLHPS